MDNIYAEDSSPAEPLFNGVTTRSCLNMNTYVYSSGENGDHERNANSKRPLTPSEESIRLSYLRIKYETDFAKNIPYSW